jgi:hypothetical protein
MPNFTERQIRDQLDDVARRFTQANPDNDYNYKLQRLTFSSDGSNWAVTPTGRLIGSFGEYDRALQAVHDAHPVID